MSEKLGKITAILLCMLILNGCINKKIETAVKDIQDGSNAVIKEAGDTAEGVVDAGGNVAGGVTDDFDETVEQSLDDMAGMTDDMIEAIKHFTENFNIVDPDIAQDVLNQLDEAIRVLDENSEEWQTVLSKLQKDIADTIETTQSRLTNDVSRILEETEQATQGTISVAGAEFRCNTEFVESKADINKRVQTKLEKLRADWTGQQTDSVIEPVFCQAIPPVIDILDIKSGATNIVSMYGYDFDGSNTDAIDLILVDSDGTEKSVKVALNKASDYQLTINVSSSGVPLNEQSSRVIVRYKGEDLYSYAVTQPNYEATRKVEAIATQEAQATETRAVEQTRTSATVTKESVHALETQSAQQTRVAATKTKQAIYAQRTRNAEKATENWLEADSDGDGWNNQIELTNGTSPNNRDTDGDGIEDDNDQRPLHRYADVTVRFTRVEILNDSDSGGKGEVRLTMTVNGQKTCWPRSDCREHKSVSTGSTYDVNQSIKISNLPQTSNLTISVNGVEFDSGLTGGDDSMRSFEKTYRGAYPTTGDGWATIGSDSGWNNAKFRMHYSITVNNWRR